MINSFSRLLFLFFVINILSIECLISQERILQENNYRIRLKYKNNQLIKFICFDLEKPFYKRNRYKKTYTLTWSCGMVELKNKFFYIYFLATYTYKFDSLLRVYESFIFSSWSNHTYEEYMARKYKDTDSLPSKCYHYSFMNYPLKEKVSWDCDMNSEWIKIIEREIKRKKANYEKEFKEVLYYNWPSRRANDLTPFWN